MGIGVLSAEDRDDLYLTISDIAKRTTHTAKHKTENAKAMTTLIIILVMLAIVLATALVVSLRDGGAGRDDDHPYRDRDGDHVYYDKSIIEKKEFHRLHPKEAARTFARLFRRK